ncbi:MAG TPA: SH3 domain-containing protein [Myxococcaceae bacterium]|nr:SH3 domain-containing protein [Myxococcaceae bacterium]
MSARAALLALLLVSVPASASEVRYVVASRARVYAAPSDEARAVGVLRIGAEVRTGRARQGWLQLSAPAGVEGWARASLLGSERPSLSSLLERADAASTPAARRPWLERAAALAPSDTKVIERLAAVLEALGDEKAAHMASKGLIAAERRALSWDGPLYPLEDDLALLPRPCPEGVTRATRDSTLPEPPVRTLRARAFPLVSSGKVVSVSGRGRRTQTLDQLVCARSTCGGTQAAYALPRPAGTGALVPSWLVAGHTVAPLVEAPAPFAAGCEDSRVFTALPYALERCGARRFRLHRRTLTGWSPLQWQEAPREEAVPIAHFSEDERRVVVLFRAKGGRACCPGETERFLWRATWPEDGGAPALEFGRVYSAGFTEGCAQERYTPLPGEPRCERLPEGCELGEP